MPMPDWLKAFQDYTQGWNPCDSSLWEGKGRGWSPRIQYDWPGLTPNSIVVDVGGYRGLWASEMAKRYNPHIYVFEPSQYSVEAAYARLGEFPKVQIWEYALGDRAGVFSLGDAERDGASFLKADAALLAYMVEGAKFLNDLTDHIDLMQINIEGFEFVLIPYLINEGYIRKIKWLQIQWHVLWDMEGNEGLQNIYYMNIIRCKIAETHDMLWNTGPFEAWALSPRLRTGALSSPIKSRALSDHQRIGQCKT